MRDFSACSFAHELLKSHVNVEALLLQCMLDRNPWMVGGYARSAIGIACFSAHAAHISLHRWAKIHV